jgi:hypothetical protein
MPSDTKARMRMIEAAHRLNMPVEEYLHLFYARKTGKLLHETLSTPSRKKKAKR